MCVRAGVRACEFACACVRACVVRACIRAGCARAPAAGRPTRDALAECAAAGQAVRPARRQHSGGACLCGRFASHPASPPQPAHAIPKRWLLCRRGVDRLFAHRGGATQQRRASQSRRRDSAWVRRDVLCPPVLHARRPLPVGLSRPPRKLSSACTSQPPLWRSWDGSRGCVRTRTRSDARLVMSLASTACTTRASTCRQRWLSC
jgi:hypothetical protein